MKILNVAEKPSVAKSISNILSTTVTKESSLIKYIPTYKFKYNNDDFIFTSVLGHLTQTEFIDKRKWDSFDPILMFDLEIETTFIDPKIKSNLLKLSKNVDKIIIWTDCDREGEHIAQEIQDIFNKKCERARFFAITKQEIENSLNNLKEINFKEVLAVKSRIELDLRIGAAFTRLQSINLKNGVISYGSCQVPTLGFVVDRNELINNFIPESFYSLNIEIKKENLINVFKWERGNFFDRNCIELFYKEIENKKVKVIKIENNEIKKLKPLPLRTVEFQKKCSIFLKIGSDKAMKTAEDLYNKGYISYPRTETDSFPRNFDFQKTLKILESEEIFKNFTEFQKPRGGKNNDQAHLPIYPLKGGSNLISEERSVYEMVLRYFLACCSKDAIGETTKVVLETNNEIFHCESLKILERNYLNIFIFEKWEEKKMSSFILNELFLPENYMLIKTEGTTTSPKHLTESELITLMDKNGIGTDSTIHEHIKKIQTRKYVFKRNKFIVPSSLGISLIKGYKLFDFEFSTPKLRSDLESKLKRIETGELDSERIVKEQLKIYKDCFVILRDNILEFKKKFDKEILNNSDPSSGDDGDYKGNDYKGNNHKGSDYKGNDYKGNDYKGSDYKGNYDKKEDCDEIKLIQIIEKRIKGNGTTELKRTTTKRTKSTKENTKENFNIKERTTENLNENTKNLQEIKSEINKKRIKCKCSKEPKIETVKKNSENLGKQFLFCGSSPKKCNFFYWVDEIRNYKILETMQSNSICECGFEPKAEVTKQGENKGKIYFKCKKVYKPCKYFCWQ